MATRYYIAANGDWNTNGNWSTTSGGGGGASYPTASDVAIFDASSGNCTLDGHQACSKLQLGRSGSVYNKTLDFGTSNMTIGTGGMDATYGSGASCNLDLGTGSSSCSGDWLGANLDTLTRGSSTLTLSKTGGTFTTKGNFNNLTISGSYTMSSGSAGQTVYGTLTVSGSLAITYAFTLSVAGALNTTGGTISLDHASAVLRTDVSGGNSAANAGTITGTAGTLEHRSGILSNTGTIDPPYIRFYVITGSTLGPGTYTASSGITITNATTNNYTLVLGSAGSQTIVFDGDVAITTTSSGTLTLDANTYDPTLEFTGSITSSEGTGDITLTAGTAVATLTGTADTTVQLVAGLKFPALTINKGSDTASVTLNADTIAQGAITGTRGTLNTNGYYLICEAGDVSFATTGGFQFTDGAGGYDQSSGNIQLTGTGQTLTLAGVAGSPGTQLQIDDLDFTVPADVTYAVTYCTVTGSAATGAGAPIDGSDASNVDDGSNSGWTLPAGGGTAYTQAIDDDLGLTDAVTRTATYPRSIADDLGLTDAVARAADYPRSITDDLGLTDAVTRTADYVRSIDDDMGTTDEVLASLFRLISQLVEDSVGLTDSVTKSLFRLISQLIEDSVGTTDTVSRIIAFAREVADDEGLSENVSRTVAYLRSVADDEGLADAVAKSASFARTIADAMGLTDEIDDEIVLITFLAAWYARRRRSLQGV